MTMSSLKKKSSKIEIGDSIRLDAYNIISNAIENGIELGWNRAHKHVEAPSKDHLLDEIHRNIMNNLCDIIKFDDE